MKLARSKACSLLLSMGIIVGSIVVPVHAAGNTDFVPKISAVDSFENPTYAIGELSEKSGDTPEKIVEKNYSKKLNGSIKQKSFKQNSKVKNSAGRTVISTVQTYKGFPVYGTDQNFHINGDGVIELIAGSNVDDLENKVISKSFTEKYSQKAVIDAAEKHLGYKPDYTKAPKAEIILYPVNGKYNYVYKVDVKSFSPYYTSCTYYINAADLSIINVYNHICSAEQPATGIGTGQMVADKTLQMVKNTDNTYSLKNTYENFGTYYASNFAGKKVNISDVLFSDSDNNFNSGDISQKAAVDAHSNITKVIKFFSGAPFYRSSNSYLKVGIVIEDQQYPTQPNAYGDVGYVAFNTVLGGNSRSLSCCMDVVAHEYFHGILNSEGMKYLQKEEMAINEGLSDIFGVLAEYFITNDGSLDDWYMGEDIGRYLRDCANPMIDEYSDFTAYLQDPYYDPHMAGGVITKAARLMAVGGTFNGVTVNAIGYGKIARIFYNLIVDRYLTSNMTFKQIANYTVQIANLLYGGNSQAFKSTKDAFTAVGLFTAAPQNFRLMYINGTQIQLAWDAPAGSRIGVYRKGSTGTKGEPVLVMTTTNQYGVQVDMVSGSNDYYIAYLDGSGNRTSTFSNAVNVENQLPKSAPTNFTITNNVFSWSYGVTGDKFVVFRKINGTNDEFLKVGETTNKQLPVGSLIGKYDFKVAVVSTDGTRISPFSNVCSVEAYSGAPTNFRLTSSTSTKATFSWNETSANRYAVYRVRTGTSDMPQQVKEVKETSLEVDLISGTYDYKVAVVDLEGNRISNFSNSVCVVR